MRNMLNAGLVVVGLGLAGSGCMRGSMPPTVLDKPRCESSTVVGQRVYVEVDYASSAGLNNHDAKPETCKVKSGAQITWIATTEDPANTFELRFKKGSPDVSGAKTITSRLGASKRQEATITTARVAVRTEYPYWIYANGTGVDPTIIIEP